MSCVRVSGNQLCPVSTSLGVSCVLCPSQWESAVSCVQGSRTKPFLFTSDLTAVSGQPDSAHVRQRWSGNTGRAAGTGLQGSQESTVAKNVKFGAERTTASCPVPRQPRSLRIVHCVTPHLIFLSQMMRRRRKKRKRRRRTRRRTLVPTTQRPPLHHHHRLRACPLHRTGCPRPRLPLRPTLVPRHRHRIFAACSFQRYGAPFALFSSRHHFHCPPHMAHAFSGDNLLKLHVAPGNRNFF